METVPTNSTKAKRTPWTQADLNVLQAKLREGHSVADIAQEMNRGVSAVNTCMSRYKMTRETAGVKLKPDLRATRWTAWPEGKPVPVSRKGTYVDVWTPELVERLRRLRVDERKTAEQAARIMGLTVNAVNIATSRNGIWVGRGRKTFTDPDGEVQTCATCRLDKPLADFPVARGRIQHSCKNCLGANYSRRHKYGVVIPPGAKCAICGGEEDLCVDHDHQTGVIRGVLCRQDNSTLGLVKDNVKTLNKLREYLEGDGTEFRMPLSRSSTRGLGNVPKNVRNAAYTYGLSPDQRSSMLDAQNNCCAGCGVPFSDSVLVHIDHSHETGRIRGTLCHSCNTALGRVNDDTCTLIRLADYLIDPPGIPKVTVDSTYLENFDRFAERCGITRLISSIGIDVAWNNKVALAVLDPLLFNDRALTFDHNLKPRMLRGAAERMVTGVSETVEHRIFVTADRLVGKLSDRLAASIEALNKTVTHEDLATAYVEGVSEAVANQFLEVYDYQQVPGANAWTGLYCQGQLTILLSVKLGGNGLAHRVTGLHFSRYSEEGARQLLDAFTKCYPGGLVAQENSFTAKRSLFARLGSQRLCEGPAPLIFSKNGVCYDSGRLSREDLLADAVANGVSFDLGLPTDKLASLAGYEVTRPLLITSWGYPKTERERMIGLARLQREKGPGEAPAPTP